MYRVLAFTRNPVSDLSRHEATARIQRSETVSGYQHVLDTLQERPLRRLSGDCWKRMTPRNAETYIGR